MWSDIWYVYIYICVCVCFHHHTYIYIHISYNMCFLFIAYKYETHIICNIYIYTIGLYIICIYIHSLLQHSVGPEMRVLIYRIFSLDDPPRTDIFLGMKPRTMQISTSVDCYLLIYLKRWDSFTIRPTDSRAVTHLKTPNNPKKCSCLQNILISSYIFCISCILDH